MKLVRTLLAGQLMLTLSACMGVPEGIEPVTNFQLDRYLGTWYEIARLDHRFERGLSNVTAEYSKRKDGGVAVLNRGYQVKDDAWEDATGKAYLVAEPNVGKLKVSFFGPFYGAYNIFELDERGYQYSMVTGPDRSYLWILARTPDLPSAKLNALVSKAKASGFDIDALIYVDQSFSKINP